MFEPVTDIIDRISNLKLLIDNKFLYESNVELVNTYTGELRDLEEQHNKLIEGWLFKIETNMKHQNRNCMHDENLNLVLNAIYKRNWSRGHFCGDLRKWSACNMHTSPVFKNLIESKYCAISRSMLDYFFFILFFIPPQITVIVIILGLYANRL